MGGVNVCVIPGCHAADRAEHIVFENAEDGFYNVLIRNPLIFSSRPRNAGLPPSIVTRSQRVGDLAWSVDVCLSIRATRPCRDTL